MPKKIKKNASASNEVRIIGGQWRSRKIVFPNIDGLRPSTDRVRETLFNWLQFDLAGSHCLDACAGSGVLGFEALSRQSASVHFVEKDPVAIEMLQCNAKNLSASTTSLSIHQMNILDFLKAKQFDFSFDVVFVDPPFAMNLHTKIFTTLIKSQCLSENALVYCEMPSFEAIELPLGWTWYRQKQYKNVSFGLITV